MPVVYQHAAARRNLVKQWVYLAETAGWTREIDGVIHALVTGLGVAIVTREALPRKARLSASIRDPSLQKLYVRFS